MKVVQNKNMALNQKNGFSLVEAILYIGLLVLIFVFLLAIYQEGVFISQKISQKIDNVENAQFALNKMVWYLQNSQSINAPQTGSASNTLSLNLADSAQNPIIFYSENNKLKIKIGTALPLDLTNNQLKVDNLSFINNGFASEPAVIQIKIQFENANSFWQTKPLVLETSVKTEK